MGREDLWLVERLCVGGSLSPSLAGTSTVSSGGRFDPFDEGGGFVDEPAFWGDEQNGRGARPQQWDFTLPVRHCIQTETRSDFPADPHDQGRRRFIRQLKERGLSGVELATSDAHEGPK